MTGKANSPPKGVAWVWLTRELLASDAWRAMSGKARKAIDFLMLEHMSHGGRANGKLKAPHRQLRKFGIGTAFTGPAMLECEQLGLIDSHRGGCRVATVYALTWLPLHDGTEASNRWREYVAEKQKSVPRTEDSATSETGYRPAKTVPFTGYRNAAKATSQTGYAYKRSSYQGGDITTELSAAIPAGLAALLEEASCLVGGSFRPVETDGSLPRALRHQGFGQPTFTGGHRASTPRSETAQIGESKT